MSNTIYTANDFTNMIIINSIIGGGCFCFYGYIAYRYYVKILHNIEEKINLLIDNKKITLSDDFEKINITTSEKPKNNSKSLWVFP